MTGLPVDHDDNETVVGNKNKIEIEKIPQEKKDNLELLLSRAKILKLEKELESLKKEKEEFEKRIRSLENINEIRIEIKNRVVDENEHLRGRIASLQDALDREDDEEDKEYDDNEEDELPI